MRERERERVGRRGTHEGVWLGDKGERERQWGGGGGRRGGKRNNFTDMKELIIVDREN